MQKKNFFTGSPSDFVKSDIGVDYKKMYLHLLANIVSALETLEDAQRIRVPTGVRNKTELEKTASLTLRDAMLATEEYYINAAPAENIVLLSEEADADEECDEGASV